MARLSHTPNPDVDKLRAAFLSLQPYLSPPAAAARQFYDLQSLENAFDALKAPLASARGQGDLINPWAIAGLGRDEVRNAAALAGLWMADFGGSSSKLFIGSFLEKALPGIDWIAEIADGYRVETEICPLGDRSDRVDLVVETQKHLVGIEIKIGARLGPEQLQRYELSITRRARLSNRIPHVILLAPFSGNRASVADTRWRDIYRAASAAARASRGTRTFTQHLIAAFGDHVVGF